MLERACAQPQGAAIVETGGRWHHWLGRPKRRVSRGEIGQRISRAATTLQGLGLVEGAAALYAVRPGAHAMVLLSALLLAGPTVVALDPGVSARLLAERLKLLAPRWVVAESIVYAAGAPGLPRLLLRWAGMVLPDIRLPGARFMRVGLRLPGVPPSRDCSSLWTAADPLALLLTSRRDRPVLALFTSGTTAAPKTALHTATSLGAACTIISRRMALRETDVVYSTQTHQMLAALLAGACCVVPPTGPDARRFIADIERYRVTHTYGMPFELSAVVARLEEQGKKLPAHLRVIVLGSAPVRPAFLTRLRAVCASDTEVWCAYGMSEIFPVSLVESREKLIFEGEGDLVGAPVEGVRVDVADDGELHVSGPNLFAGYVGQPPLTVHATGDLARIDTQGRIVLLGRKKDMIIRGPHNIYPSLYEATIAAIPGVETCALVGLPNADGTDERLVLAVQPRAGEDGRRIRDRVQCALRDGSCAIDAFARPDDVVVCTLPLSGRSAKIDRGRLLAQLAARSSSHAG